MQNENAAKAITGSSITKGILYVVCGVPGSGKSTLITEQKYPEEKRVSRDVIRFSILKDGEEYFSHEYEVYTRYINEIVDKINAGINVYADATHLTQGSRRKLISELRKKNCFPSEINAIYFDLPVDVCLNRNEKRYGMISYVPRGKIRKMYEQYVFPTHIEGFKNIYRIDMDGNVTKEG